MRRHPRRLAATFARHPGSRSAMLIALLVLVIPNAAHAGAGPVTCSLTGPTLTFGTVNPYSGFPYSTSGNISYSCTNGPGPTQTLYLCLSIGTGSGGTTAGNRTLASGGATIPVQITNGALPQIGNGTTFSMEGPISFSVPANRGVAAGNLPLAVSMPAPGSPPTPGTYSSSFTTTDAQVLYLSQPSGGPTTCPTLVSALHDTAQADFSISATVPTQCTVSATSLAFPAASALSSPVTATATVSTTCNASTPVTVALDNGATGTGPTARQMKSGSNAITYGIYQDAGATLPWGNTAGTNTASVSGGTGTLTAYGLVPAQTGPPPGSYSDVVNVIITY